MAGHAKKKVAAKKNPWVYVMVRQSDLDTLDDLCVAAQDMTELGRRITGVKVRLWKTVDARLVTVEEPKKKVKRLVKAYGNAEPLER